MRVTFFFFNATATTEIYTLSLHDALPICCPCGRALPHPRSHPCGAWRPDSEMPRSHSAAVRRAGGRSEEHTSELQSQFHLVCRLLLEKKKKKIMPLIRSQLIKEVFDINSL